MKTALVCLLCMLFAGAAVAVQASDDKGGHSCPQALAAYSSQDKSVSVEFSGAGDLSFAMLVEGLDRRFEGHVYPGEDDDVVAVVLDNCPDGDATGDEIDACTVWQGPMQRLEQDGTEGDFSLVNGPAAPGLAFAGLVQSISERMPDLLEDPSATETETLTLSACME